MAWKSRPAIGLICFFLVWFCFSFTAEGQPIPPGSPHPILELERVVLVQRHGVRSPTQDAAELKKWAEKNWPDWGVGPGELTDHGREVIKLVARTLGGEYQAKGLLACSGLAGDPSIMVWADSKDERTRQSGEILAGGLMPHCRSRVPVGFLTPVGRKDKIFDSLDRQCFLDPEEAQAAVMNWLDSQALIDPSSRAALNHIQEAMAPRACQGGTGVCLDGDSEILATREHIHLTGPLAVGSTAAEIFLLQYAQGLPLEQVAWGRGTDIKQITRFMAVHERADKLTRELDYVALRRGSQMAGIILDTLKGTPRGIDPRIDKDLKLLALAGHDTNLSNLAGIFGLDLRVEGQPDSTAPATALVFELWRHGETQRRYVRPRVFYLDLDQMRYLKPAKAREKTLTFQYCANDGPKALCPLSDLSGRIEQRIPPACR